MQLYRCDWCYNLIDPVEGDEVVELHVELSGKSVEDSHSSTHLCEDCRPDSAGAHLDWVEYHMDDD